MKNFLSIRVVALILGVLTLILLTSCGNQDPQTLSPAQDGWQAHQDTSSFAFMNQVPAEFRDNEDFMMCVKSNTDMCMEEVSYDIEWSMTITCDMYLSEQNRSACEFNKVTSQAMSEWDIRWCSSLDGSFRESCELEVSMRLAMESGDVSICENLEDFEKVDCNNRIILAQATRNKDTQICDNMIKYEWDDENFEKQMCLDEVQFMLDMEAEQARIDEENSRILAEEEAMLEIEDAEIFSEE